MIDYKKLSTAISNCADFSDEEKSLAVKLLQANQENRLIELVVPIGTTVWIPQQIDCCCDHSLDYISIVKCNYQLRFIDKTVFTSYQEAREWARQNYPGLCIE